jgi:hypothetical protein
MAVATRTAVVLEHASQEFVDATSAPPFLYELTPFPSLSGLSGTGERAGTRSRGRPQSPPRGR